MESMCRLCLSITCENAKNIFENGFDKVIKDSFGVELTMIPNWPSDACLKCVYYLNGLEEFKATIEASQKHLQKMESQTMVIEEPPIANAFEEVVEVAEELSASPRRKSSRLISKPEVVKSSPERPKRTRRSSTPVTPEETPKRKYGKRKTKSPKLKEELPSSEDESDDNGNSQMEESNTSLNASKKILEEQMRILNLLHCQECEFEADSFLILNRHYQDEHQTRGYVKCCNRKYSRNEVTDHMRYHLDKNAFKCDECGKVWTSGAQLRSHKTYSHRDPEDCKFQCETCGKKLPTVGQYNSHMKSHIPKDKRAFKCKLCPKTFNLKAMLKKHVLSIHEHPTTHICEVCGKGLPSAEHLRIHKQTHKAAQTTECDICGKHYFYMAVHKKRIHGPQTLIKCEYCGIMVNQIYYKKHLKRLHVDVKMHKCDLCGKEFKILENFNVHMDIHFGVKYDCYFCPHQATSVPNRIKHMKEKHKEDYLEFRRNKFTEVRVKNVT